MSALSGVLALLNEVGITQADLDKAVADSAEAKDAVIKKAEEVRDFWRGIAPIFGDRPPKRAEPPHGEPGDYKNSIRIKYEKDKTGKLIAKVGTKDEKAAWIEFGAVHMPEYAC